MKHFLTLNLFLLFFAGSYAQSNVINVRLYGGTAPFTNSQWNNWNIGTAAFQTPMTSDLFRYADGSSSSVYASLSIQGGLYDNGPAYGQNASMCPDSVLRFVSYITSTRTLIIRGLDNASKYNVELYASRTGTSGQVTKFAIGTQSVNVATDNNTSNIAAFSSVTPSGGAVSITISRVVTYNYINGFKITRVTANTPPTVNAGSNQTITLPASSVTLTGTATQGSSPVTSTTWSQVSGPASAAIQTPSNLSTVVSSLVQGVYVFKLLAIDANGLKDSATVSVTVNPAASNSSINVRLYGGTAPFTNSQWNNWNIGTAAFQTPMTSDLFRYADGSPSSVYASLSIQGGLYDNGSAYGQNASMCPDSVLRFVSYITSTRTLIIRGLDNASKYNVELYASRTGTSGQVTKFAIGTQSVNVATDNNTSNAAAFSSVTPSGGAVSITISRVVTYNYINGFKITRVTANTPPTVNAGSNQTITLPASSVTLTGTATQGSSPVTSTTWSQVSGPASATIQTPSNLSTVVSSLVQGVYVFKLLAIDANGLKDSATVSVTVNPAANIPPQVNAGNNQTITLPASSVTLTGTATAGSSPISSTTWSQVSGPNTANIQSPSSLSTVVSNLIQGVYVFKLRAIDANGLKDSANVSVTVNAAGGRKHIVLLGSSTAAGFFNGLYPIDSCYAKKLQRYYQQAGIIDTVYMLAANGENPYQAMPSWYRPDASLQPPSAYTYDPNRNITRALTLHPDVILLHYPTNNFDVLTMAQVMFAFRTIKATADSAGVPVFFIGTHPRGNWSVANKQKLVAIDDSLKAAFGPLAISYYDSVATAPRSLYMNPAVSLGDSIHMNPKGHSIVFRQIVNANIFGISSGVYAGSNQTIRLPLSSVSLNGLIISGSDPIVSTSWSQVSGPNTAAIQNPSSLNTAVSNLIIGTYIFKLTGTHSQGGTSSSTMQVTVLSYAPPAVNAGENQTILLPASSATLSGTVAKGGGGSVVSTLWSQQSGPNTASIASPGSLTTGINGLIAGTYLFRLTATDSVGNSAYDSVLVMVTSGQSINVRLYGGTAPFMNSQWNNWNVGTAAFQTPAVSAPFKYADGTSSSVYAALSIQGGLSDNGAGYTHGATMCPDTVLRFVSYITSTRTLTIRGLDNASQYFLELYASKSGTSGQITKFAVAGQSVNISTDNNVSSAAVFSAISPVNGNIVVTISRVVTYNYINGFKLTKVTGGLQASPAGPGLHTGESEDREKLINIRVFPNPVSDNLNIINPGNNPLLIEIFDLAGQRLVVFDENASAHQVNMGRLKNGPYVLLVTDKKTGKSCRKIIVKI